MRLCKTSLNEKPHFRPYTLRTRLLVNLAALILSAESAAAEPNEFANEGAATISKNRLEIGVFSQAKWGVTERIEVGVHPIGVFLLPSARVKINWWQDGIDREEGAESPSLWFATLHRLSIPTPFLNLVAKEGSLGLLPADSDVPFAIQMENSALDSRDFSGHIATIQGGLGIAIQEDSSLPVLDFPFLYTTLAPLYSPIALRASLALEGRIHGPFDYQLIQRMNWWRPFEEVAWPGGRAPWVYAQETVLRTHLRFGKRHRLSLGLTASVAHYPVGYRFYWLPTVDYRVVLF